MANDPILDEINLTTLKEIEPRVIIDNFFLDTPLQAYLRAKALVPFGGGAYTQTTFLYAPMIGGAYAKGAQFNVTKRQTLAGTQFDPRYYVVAVPEFKEDMQVLNKGPLAIFSLIEADLRNAVNTISAITAIDMSLHGQASGTGIVGNRPNSINGWIEALNDGVTPGWDGSIFTAYGTAPRNGVISNKLNSVPLWGGTSLGAAAPITYSFMEEAYQTASIGRKEPDLIPLNKALYAFIKERIQPQQRFAQERDPFWGVSGMRFNSAMILKDDYFPSLKFGQNDPDLGSWLTSTFTSPATVGAGSNMPTSVTINVGEVLAMFHTADWMFRISDDPEYGGGFSGFFPAQDSTKVVGHTKLACNLECISPRTQIQGFGFNG